MEEIKMTDNLKKKGPKDRARVNKGQKHERAYQKRKKK